MAGKPNTCLDNGHHLVIGTSGSGKTSWIKQQALKPGRVIAWDPDEDYPLQRLTSMREFAAALAQSIRTKSAPRIAVTVPPSAAAFEQFCLIVWAYVCSTRPCIVIAEEIADVTPPGKAGRYWGMLCRRSRKYGVRLYAVTQRPAECDKTIYSQAAYKWIGALDNEIDRKRLASLIGLKPEQIAALARLEFYYKKPGPEPATKGRVKLPKL